MDLSKVKAKLKSLEKSNKKSDYLWKPELGSNLVRFVPAKYNPEYPFLEMFFYYDLEKYPVISPISFGLPDPIVEMAEKLKSTGDTEDWILGKNLEPKLRTYAPVLVRGKEKEGVKYYGFGKTVFEELLKLIDDPDYGDITDPKQGTDITIEYTKNEGDNFPTTTLRPKRNISPMTDDPEVLESVKEMVLPEDIWTAPSYEEMQSKLEAYVGATKEEGERRRQASKEEKSSSTDQSQELKETASESTGGIAPTNDPDDLLNDIFAD